MTPQPTCMQQQDQAVSDVLCIAVLTSRAILSPIVPARSAAQQKQALVKLRACPACAYKLNYKREKAYEKAGGRQS